MLLAGCSLPDGSQPPTVTRYGGQAHIVPGAVNTVQLVITGTDGVPAPGAAVDLTLDANARSHGTRLAAAAAGPVFDSLTVSADSRGLATAYVTFGSRPGRMVIHARATSVGAADSLVYEFAPATPASVDLNPIAPLYPGDSVAVTWIAYDAAFTHVFADLTLTIDNPAVASVRHGDLYQALDYGFTWIRGSAPGTNSDSIPLAVVPAGNLGAFVSGAWRETTMNGVTQTGIFTPAGGFGDPRYSPSHDTLAFQQLGHLQIRLPGGTIVPVVPAILGFAGEQNPEWSADGQWLYFTAMYADGRREIWRIHPDGTGGVRVGPVAAAGETDNAPAVNAAQTRLAFITNRTLAAGAPTLRIIDLGNGSTVFQGPAATTPRFSPSGASIAFITAGQLRIANADGSNLRTLAGSMSLWFGPLTWSPDSRWIAASHGTGAGVPIYVHLVDTQTDTPIRLPYAFAWTMPDWK